MAYKGRVKPIFFLEGGCCCRVNRNWMEGHLIAPWKVVPLMTPGSWCHQEVGPLNDTWKLVPLNDTWKLVPLNDTWKLVPLNDTWKLVPLNDTWKLIPHNDTWKLVSLNDT